METTSPTIEGKRTLPTLATVSGWLTWPRVAVVILTVVGLLLRRYHINTQSFWFDEADIVARSQADVGSLLLAFTSAGENGPLYTLILHFWTRIFGESETAVRTLSALFGAAAIPLLYLFSNALLGANGLVRRWVEGVSVLAAALLTIAPFHLWYSQEAKMYTLVVLATLGSMYTFVLALAGDTPKRWATYVVVTLLALYAHGMAVLILLAQLVYYAWLLATRRRALATSRYWLRASVVMLIPFVPILALRADFLLNTQQVSQFYQPTTLGDILQAVIVTFSLNRLPDGMQAWEIAGGALFTLLALAGLISLVRTHPQSLPEGGTIVTPDLGTQHSALSTQHSAAALLLCYLLVPVVGFWLITLRAPLFAPRYLIIALPAWLMLVALGIAAPLKGVAERATTLPEIWRRLATPGSGDRNVGAQFIAPHQPENVSGRDKSRPYIANVNPMPRMAAALLAITLVALTSGAALAGINFTTQPTKEDWRGALLYVKTHMRAGDVVIVYPGYLLTAADYYMSNGPGPAEKPNVPIYGIEPRIVMSGTMRELDATFSDIISGTRRAWLVQSPERVRLEDPRGSVKWWLDGNYIEDDAQFYNGVDVYGVNFNGIVGQDYPRPQTYMGYKFSNPTNGDNLTLLGFNYEPRNQPWLPPSPNSHTEQGRCTFADLGAGKCQPADLPALPRADYFPLTLYWRIDQTALKADYIITLAYVDKGGKVIGSVTLPPLNGYLLTSKWHILSTYMDFRDLWVAGDQPPGTYAIQVQVAPISAPRQPLSAIDGDGNNVGNTPTLTRLVTVKQ